MPVNKYLIIYSDYLIRIVAAEDLSAAFSIVAEDLVNKLPEIKGGKDRRFREIFRALDGREATDDDIKWYETMERRET